MKPKEGYWIGAKGGLLAEKHYRTMRDSVWLFLYFLLRQTTVNDAGEGVVLYGNSLTREKIAADTGWSERNIKDWTARLIRTGYVRAVRSGVYGCIFFVCKAKSKVKNPKPNVAYFPVECRQPVNKTANECPQVSTVSTQSAGRNTVQQNEIPGRKTVRTRTENCPTESPKPLKNEPFVSVPTSLIPKHLSNYNTDAAANCAAGVSSLSLSQTLEAMRRKTPLQGKSQPVERPAKELEQANVAFEELKKKLKLGATA